VFLNLAVEIPNEQHGQIRQGSHSSEVNEKGNGEKCGHASHISYISRLKARTYAVALVGEASPTKLRSVNLR
jgi:hypothetical protein